VNHYEKNAFSRVDKVGYAVVKCEGEGEGAKAMHVQGEIIFPQW